MLVSQFLAAFSKVRDVEMCIEQWWFNGMQELYWEEGLGEAS